MEEILKRLRWRTNRTLRIYRFFIDLKISITAKENFVQVIGEGIALNNILSSISILNYELRNRIENYFIATEESVFAAGIELPFDFCTVIETLEDLREERLLLMAFIDGILE